MGTPSEEVGYSLAITITLCTPAPLCPPPPPVTLPPSLFLLFRSSRPRLDSPFSLSFPLSLFSSLLCHVVPSPLGPRSSCCIDHGYSAIVFNLPCSCCGCRLQENFACLSLLRTLLEFLSFSLSFPFSRLFPSLFIPFFPLLPGTPGWHQFLEPSHLPPDFCVSSHPLHFLSFSKWTSEFMRRN